MTRNLFLTPRTLLPCLGTCALLTLVACGGKNRSSAPTPGSIVNPEGSWSGTYKTAAGSTEVSALVLGNGKYIVFDAKGASMLFGTLSKGWGMDSTLLASGKISSLSPMVKSYTSGTSLVMTDGASGTFTFDTSYSGYDRSLDLTALTEPTKTFTSHAEENSLGKEITLNLASGTFHATGPEFEFIGSFTVPNPAKSAFQMEGTLTKGTAVSTGVEGAATYFVIGTEAAPTLDLSVAGADKSTFVATFH